MPLFAQCGSSELSTPPAEGFRLVHVLAFLIRVLIGLLLAVLSLLVVLAVLADLLQRTEVQNALLAFGILLFLLWLSGPSCPTGSGTDPQVGKEEGAARWTLGRCHRKHPQRHESDFRSERNPRNLDFSRSASAELPQDTPHQRLWFRVRHTVPSARRLTHDSRSRPILAARPGPSASAICAKGFPYLQARRDGKLVFFREQVIAWTLKRQRQKGGIFVTLLNGVGTTRSLSGRRRPPP